MKDFISQEKFTFSDLIEIIECLRAPDGCPWDREQTPSSIRTNIIEEAYELTEAIDLNDDEKMCEECGDVLLQGVFCAVMRAEAGGFTVDDVINGLCKKLVGRHTHIFGKDKAKNGDEALAFWEKAKAKEKHYTSIEDKLASVPKTFTALQRANKVQKIVKKTGFEFACVEDAEQKIEEELTEFRMAEGTDKEKEGGDILFSVVNVLRMNGIDPEVALTGTTDKFLRRFNYMIAAAKEQGKNVEELSVDDQEKLYEEAKEKGL